MNNKGEIALNHFQLNVLLNDEKKEYFNYLINNGVTCVHCQDICRKGVEVKEVRLTRLNDIKVKGICNKCGNPVTRVMEFGEEKEFFEQADHFRKSIG
jgi:heterodisulfide reductase subunit C